MWSDFLSKYDFFVKQRKNAIDDIPLSFFGHHISIEEIYSDGKTTLTKDGSLVGVVLITNGDNEYSSNGTKEKLRRIKKSFLENLDPGLQIQFINEKRKNRLNGLPKIGNKIADKIQSLYMNNFESENYETYTYIVFSSKPINLIRSNFKLASKNLTIEKERLKSCIIGFWETVNQSISIIAEFKPEIVESRKLVKFWYRRYNGLSDYQTSNQREFLPSIVAKNNIELMPKDGLVIYEGNDSSKKFSCFLSIKELPQETFSTILDLIYKINCEFELCQIITPKSLDDNNDKIINLTKSLRSFNNFNRGVLTELEEAAEEIASSNIIFFDYILTIQIFGESKKHLNYNLKELTSCLALSGIIPIKETWNIHASIFGRQPNCYDYLKPRSFLLSTDNLSHLVKFLGFDKGHNKTALGNSAICYFKMLDGSAYKFNLHPDSDLTSSGHTAIIAPTGCGKSTAMMFILAHCLKYKDFKTLIFDAGKGVKIPTLILNGGDGYNVIGADDGNSINMNPFRSLKDNSNNREFLINWLAGLANTTSEHDINVISKIVDINYDFPENERRFYSLKSLLIQGGKNSSLIDKLDKWLPDGYDDSNFSNKPLGRYFNSAIDDLEFKGDIVAFDMDNLLSNQKLNDSSVNLLGPITSYIFHKFRTLADEKPIPHFIFVDEARSYIEDPIFSKYLLDLSQKQRKKMGSLILAGQDPSIFTGSQIGKKIMQNIETFMIWPNQQAVKQDYLDEGIGLNDVEFDWVRKSVSKRHVLVKRRRTGQSVIINLDLSSIGQFINCFASKTSNIKQLEKCISNNEEDWIMNYLNSPEG